MTWGNLSTHGARLHFPGTVVHNAIGPAAMTDLDLSSVVGARQALAYIRCENQTGAGCQFYFRTNGETLSAGGAGVHNAAPAATNRIGYVWVITDTAGIVEWQVSVVAGTVKLTVEAYAHA
jgi:hypothetical protein